MSSIIPNCERSKLTKIRNFKRADLKKPSHQKNDAERSKILFCVTKCEGNCGNLGFQKCLLS